MYALYGKEQQLKAKFTFSDCWDDLEVEFFRNTELEFIPPAGMQFNFQPHPFELFVDIVIWYPDETPFPTRAKHLKNEGRYIYEIDSWGRTIKRRPDAFFTETIEAPLQNITDIDSVEFDSPKTDSRYLTGKMTPSVTVPLQMFTANSEVNV